MNVTKFDKVETLKIERILKRFKIEKGFGLDKAVREIQLLMQDDEEIIGFADWLEELSPTQKVSVWSKNGEHSGLFTMDNEQLLDKYKRALANER